MTKGKADVILELLTDKGSDGATEKEIANELDYRLDEVKLIVKKLYKKKLIFRSLSQNKWKLVEYRNENDTQSNSKMEWN